MDQQTKIPDLIIYKILRNLDINQIKKIAKIPIFAKHVLMITKIHQAKGIDMALIPKNILYKYIVNYFIYQCQMHVDHVEFLTLMDRVDLLSEDIKKLFNAIEPYYKISTMRNFLNIGPRLSINTANYINEENVDMITSIIFTNITGSQKG